MFVLIWHTKAITAEKARLSFYIIYAVERGLNVDL